MTTRRTLPVLLFALTLPAAPALAAPNKEHLQLLAEIRMLQEQNQQLQQLLGTLQDTLKTVSTKIDDQSAAMRKAMADQSLAVTNIGENVRTLREKAEESNVRISTVAQEIESLRQSMTAPAPQPSAPPRTGGVEPSGGTPPGTVPPAGATPPPVSPVPGSVSPQRMYEASYDDYTAGRWSLAIQGFESFIQMFPRLAQAADAQYNIGMSYYNQSDWPQARNAFQKVINDYPNAQGTTLPDAYYKLGQTFERLTQVDNAKRAYETLVQKFPATFSASQARQALDRLNRR